MSLVTYECGALKFVTQGWGDGPVNIEPGIQGQGPEFEPQDLLSTKPGVWVSIYNLSTGEAETGRSQGLHGQPALTYVVSVGPEENLVSKHNLKA